MEKVILQTDFKNLKLFKRGKVRDIYDLGDSLLMVSSDRLSAFDVIMQDGIPFKGKVLTKISEFWFNYVEDIVENHIIATNPDEYPESCNEYIDDLRDRSMIVKKSELIPLECIVRGYVSGSGWNDYKKDGSICGIELEPGLKESAKLFEPIFTPSTKAEIGDHDENISEDQARSIIGAEFYDTIKEKAIAIYSKAAEYAIGKGIIIADTKMEFGIYEDQIIIIDELLTPDSSRFWPLDKYEPGRSQDSYDKQYVRDYLLSISFNKQPPPPKLPVSVIENTTVKYKEALNRLTGIEL